MKGMERQEFEVWKKAFGEAELSPSDSLWTNIALELEKADGEKMKRRIIFYKLMAAASIAFALCISGIGAYYYNAQDSSNQLAFKTDRNINHRTESNINYRKQSANTLQQDVPPLVKGNKLKISIRSSSGFKHIRHFVLISKTSSASDGSTLVDPTDTNEIRIESEFIHSLNANTKSLVLSDSKLPPLVKLDKIQYRPSNVEPEPDPFIVMMAKLERREQDLLQNENQKNKSKAQKKSSNKSEKLWTSLGFAAGTFTATNASINSSSSTFSNALVASNKVAPSPIKSQGTSYSMGLNLGTRITERWILQGGVNYQAQNSTYQSTVVRANVKDQNFKEADFNSNIVPLETPSDNIIVAPPHNVNNNLQYINIPVQAGYMAINRLFGVQVNAGVATDLFLQSTLSVDKSNLQKTTQKNGTNSSYRPVNFSGLMGTEVSYRIGKHYRLALNPGVRYPLSSIYKADIGIKSTPLTFDVGMKFRYIFH